jgi:hypothetical protein
MKFSFVYRTSKFTPMLFKLFDSWPLEDSLMVNCFNKKILHSNSL